MHQDRQEANRGVLQIPQARLHGGIALPNKQPSFTHHHLVPDQDPPTLPHYHHPQAHLNLNFQRLFSNTPRSSLPSQFWLPHEISSSSEASSLTLNSADGVVSFSVAETKHEEQMEEFDMIVNERRVRRLLSNRESARRSRMRKRKQLEELQGQVLQLLAANHQLTEKLNSVLECNYRVLQENSQLKEDNSSLRMVVGDLMNHQHLHDHDHHVGPQAIAGSGSNGGGDEEVERNMIRVRANHTITSSMDIIR